MSLEREIFGDRQLEQDCLTLNLDQLQIKYRHYKVDNLIQYQRIYNPNVYKP